ncbi:MAG: SDR family oxidoreductase [Ardenticatenaceae bacterium]|nr:SDR family oxidoreductase [Anaerolineales bacterium]MCB8976012.1 SDR family oxidoreductase [Ardenticatenaceae bacterium]
MKKSTKVKRVLVTGVTGYVGGRLVPQLLANGYAVRVMIRGSADRLNGRYWQNDVEIVTADVFKPETLTDALQDVDAAYYLIHSMDGHGAFQERDKEAARNFAQVAANANVKRIIYLGGLGSNSDELSDHLRSRQEVGRVLAETGVPVTEFRAAIVVGSGSVSFEMIRHLTERLPIMITPKWVHTRIQPIAIDDLLSYLVAALEQPESAGKVIEIGGADVLTYKDMMLKYAEARQLNRHMVPVPFLSPRLSSHWVHVVTPIPSGIARPLIEGLGNEVVVTNDEAHQLFPQIQPMGYEQAINRALERIREGEVETIWSDAEGAEEDDLPPLYYEQEQGVFIERREKVINAKVSHVFRAFTRFGGEYGWPPFDSLWHIRGAMDRLVGGVGLRRGRPQRQALRAGDALDFWRVERIVPNKLLRLQAEMKLPGKAWLQFEVAPDEEDPEKTKVVQTAFFAPKGLFGLLYWYALLPLHVLIFPGMVNDIARQAEKWSNNEDAAPQTLRENLAAYRALLPPLPSRTKLLTGSAIAFLSSLLLFRLIRRSQG